MENVSSHCCASVADRVTPSAVSSFVETVLSAARGAVFATSSLRMVVVAVVGEAAVAGVGFDNVMLKVSFASATVSAQIVTTIVKESFPFPVGVVYVVVGMEM